MEDRFLEEGLFRFAHFDIHMLQKNMVSLMPLRGMNNDDINEFATNNWTTRQIYEGATNWRGLHIQFASDADYQLFRLIYL